MKHNLWNLIAALKNGSIAKKQTIAHVNKKINAQVLNVLWKKGYISGYKKNLNNPLKLDIFLKHDRKASGIKNIKAISKPGNRVYCSASNLWEIHSTNSLVIISTNLGIKSLDECKCLGVGGEPLIIVR